MSLSPGSYSGSSKDYITFLLLPVVFLPAVVELEIDTKFRARAEAAEKYFFILRKSPTRDSEA